MSNASRIIRRGIERGVQNLFQRPQWHLLIGAMCGIYILAQFCVLGLLGTKAADILLTTKSQVRIEILDGASPNAFQEFFIALGQQPFVRTIQYIPQEKLFERARQESPDLVAFLDQYQIENPYKDTVSVSIKRIEDYDRFADFTKDAKWQAVIDPTFLSSMTQQQSHVFTLLDAANGVTTGVTILLAITICSLVLLGAGMLTLASDTNRDEVLVQKIAGASRLSILAPYIAEQTALHWICIGLSGVALSILLPIAPELSTALQPGGIGYGFLQELQLLLPNAAPLVLLTEVIAAPVLAWMSVCIGLRNTE